MKKNITLIIILSGIFISSCNLFNTEKNEEISVYKSNKLWEKELYIQGSVEPKQKKNYIYGFEITEQDENEVIKRERVFKLDLNTGEYEWQSESGYTDSEENIEVYNDKVFVYLKNGRLWILDNETGTKLATIKLMLNDGVTVAYINYPAFLITSDGKYLVYSYDKQNLINDDGIMRLKLSDIDFTKPADEEQILYPELIWHGEMVDPVWNEDEYIFSMLVEENGTVYFKTCAQFKDGYHTRLGAINVEIAEVKWIRNLNDEFLGGVWNSLYIQENNLFVFENAIGCYNKYNGKTVAECIQAEKDYLNKPRIGGLVLNKAGVFYDDGCFYYTTADTYMDPIMTNRKLKDIGNVKCLAIKENKIELKWQYLTGNCGFSSTRPVVTDGKVFVNTWGTGLWVLDKKTGKPIGVDSSVTNSGADRNYLWNGNVIYFRDVFGKDVRTRVLTCIKP